MRAGAATMLSAAVLLAPGCDRRPEPKPGAEEALRRAAYRSLAARERLERCASTEIRAATAYEDRRLSELKRLAAGKGAGHALWRGENDWNAVAADREPPPCPPGEAPSRLAAYGARLDALGRAVAEFRQ